MALALVSWQLDARKKETGTQRLFVYKLVGWQACVLLVGGKDLLVALLFQKLLHKAIHRIFV